MGYVWAGWLVTAAGIAAYSWRTLRRGRALTRALPPEERTWR